MSEDKALKILAGFLEAVEAACVGCKHRIAELTGVGEQKIAKKANPDLDRIKWQSADGARGPYDWADEPDNPEFQNLSAVVAEHKGKMRIGPYFVWRFSEGTKIGRKLVK